MRRDGASVLACVCLLGFAVCRANAAEPTPPSAADLVDIRRAEAVALAPDGRRATVTVSAYPDEADDNAVHQPRVFVVPTRADDAGIEPLLASDRASREPAWSPDGDRVAVVMDDEAGRTRLYRVDPDSGAADAVTPGEAHASPSAPTWSPNGDRIAFLGPEPEQAAAWRARDPRVASDESPNTRLWVVPAEGGQPKPITPVGWDVEGMTWSPDGERLAVITAGLESDRYSLVTLNAAGGDRETLSHEANWLGTRNQILDWSPGGDRIAFAHTRSPNHYGHAIGVIAADGGGFRRVLDDHPGTIMRAEWADEGENLLAQVFQGQASRLLRVAFDDANNPTTLTTFNAGYPGYTASDGTIVYLASEADSPANLWRYRADAADERLTDLNPALRQRALGAVETVTWVHPDEGHELAGILVTPPASAGPGPWPLVVQPHGGPHHHWWKGWRGAYDDWAQWLAPRGYAVFLPNPRGSTGRGQAFARALENQLGDPDGEDILAGVDALVERGIADPERLYIGGGSYAGFFTSWLLTKTDRFRAAVVWAGISDFVSFAGSAGLGDAWSEAFFPASVQHRMAAYADRSPIRYLDRVETPTLIMHGEDDGKIPASQARQLHHGLQALGVESELVIYPDAGHGLSEYGHQIDALERIQDWIEAH